MAAKALARDPAIGNRMREAWVSAYLDRGNNLVRFGQDEQAEAAFAKALSRDPSASDHIDEARLSAYLDRGGNLVRDGKNEEAKTVFAKALTHYPSASSRINQVWEKAYLDRGGNLVRAGKDEEAKTVFEMALASYPAAAKRIDEVWIRAYLDRGGNFLNEAVRDSNVGGEKRREALAVFDHAVTRSRSANVAPDLLADAVLGRGRAHDALKQYPSAILDFKEASRLGHRSADLWMWWATDRLSDQLLQQGKKIDALLMTTTNYLDLTPELKKTGRSNDFKSNVSMWDSIARLHGDLLASSNPSPVTDCDRLAANPSDPYRVAPGVPFDTLDASSAFAACDEAAKKYPQEPRYRYQRARALSRTARLTADDTSKAEKSDAAAIADLKGAMAEGYPMAFNNMAFALLTGEGVAKDQDRGADLRLETFNRVIHCCWVPVARYVLKQEEQHDAKQVRRVVHELLMWADALGSESAGQMLSELYSKGTLVRPADRPAIGKADFQALPPWLR